MTETERNIANCDTWSSLEPYAQLMRTLLPRAECVAVFDPQAELRWSSTGTASSDLVSMVCDTLDLARAETDSAGQLRLLVNDQPVYLCWLRRDGGHLLAIVALTCRDAGENGPLAFSLVQSLLRPALECLRRDLLARATIGDLNRAVSALDRDLEVLLADSKGTGLKPGDSIDDLKAILQNATDHLQCVMAAIIVPDKGIVQMRLGSQKGPDGQILTRVHRQLLSMAQMRAAPVIINQITPSRGLSPIPYRILSCPVRQPVGRAVGVLALFREDTAPAFLERDARFADVLARRATNVIETNYDPLSGLFTRTAFEQRMRSVMAEPGRTQQWSALYIDSDQLHVINDNFGMHVGDSVIAQLGELVRRRLPPGAFAARISGDRFAALLPTESVDAVRFAEALREGAEQLGAVHGDARLHVSISVGVAPVDSEVSELSHALAAAETACKAAKDRGRNRVEAYQAEDQSIVRRYNDIDMGTRVRDAISANRLRLDSQLILPLDPGGHAVPHFELLLRMIDDEGKAIGPDGFLSAANRYQLMPEIDRWVIREAISMLQPHASLLSPGSVAFAINFSGQSLNDESFGDFLLEALQASGIDPQVFCFELTENATIAHIARAEVLMRRLRRLGCGVALDDFGTGLSSLSYLRRLPVTMLKIDGSFIRDILKDPRAESMVRAIAQLARSMSLATVAEYVETDEIRTRVAEAGVDYGQGFAIGRPSPLVDILDELPLLLAAAPVSCEFEETHAERHIAGLR